MSALIVRAAEFARHAHDGQLQPDGITYFEGHLMVVADILFDAGASREMIAASYLHSAVIQRLASLDEIERVFGVEVAALVGGLTDRWHGHIGRLNQAQDRALELERLASESTEVQTIQLADDLARLREADLLDPRSREGLLADAAARVQYLVLADSQVRYQLHAALSRWTDSSSTFLRALAIMQSPADSRRH
jgi:(p)ppGpp synthase/HD superfamily hydrolase